MKALLVMTVLLVPSLAYGGNPPSIDLVAPHAGGCLTDSICPPGRWTLTFDDEFNGNSLDTSKWKVKPAGEVIANQGCSGGSAGISVGGGFLTLSPVEPSTVNCSGYTPQGACGTPCGGEEIITPTGYGPGDFE